MPPHEVTFETALAAFCDKAATQFTCFGNEPIGTRWSLAEVGLLDALPQEFVAVAVQLAPEHFVKLEKNMLALPLKERGLRGTPPTARAAMGLFLLTAFAYVAREHASQGTLWPFVWEHLPAKLFIQPAVRASLFGGGDNPTPCELVKESVRAAVAHYPIKHAIDTQGTQKWYLTVHLQYGFSDKHFEEAGDRWLAGVGLPNSVELLLGQARCDEHNLASDRFRRFWNVLRAFHYGEVGLERARAEVTSFRWMGGTRLGRLLTAVESFDQRRAMVRVDAASEPESLRLCNPILHQPLGGSPVWLYGLEVSRQYPLHRDEYSVHVNSRKVGRIFADLDQNGSTVWKGAHQISTTSSCPLPAVVVCVPLHFGPWREPSLMGEGGAASAGSFALTEEQLIRSDIPLALSHDDEDSTIWRPWDGRDTCDEIVLAIPPSYENATCSWQVLRVLSETYKTGWRLLVLKVSALTPLSLSMDEQVVWEFEMEEQKSSVTETLELKRDSALGDSKSPMRLRLVGGAGVVIQSANCAGKPLAVIRGHSIEVPVDCFGPSAVAARIRLDICMDGVAHVLFRTVRFPVPCLRVDTQFGVSRVDPSDVLYLSDFTTIRFWHPDGNGVYGDANRLPYLFEGRRPFMPAKELSGLRVHRFRERLAGFGEPISFGSDLIPHDGGRSRHILAKQVLACGILSGAPLLRRSDEEGGGLLLEIESEDIKPQPDWRVEILTASGKTVCCGTTWIADLFLLEAKAREGEFVPAVEEILAVRVVIDGCVRGRWERAGCFTDLPGTPQERWRTALEWELAAFPLSTEDEALFRRALLDEPAIFLSPVRVKQSHAGVHPLGQPGLIQREFLRRLLAEAHFDSDQAGRLCDAIADHQLNIEKDEPNRVICALVEAARIDPSLPHRLIKALAKDPGLPNPRERVRYWRQETVAGLRQGMTADAFEHFVLNDADPQVPLKPRSPIALAQVDAGFVEATIGAAKTALQHGRTAGDLHQENLDALCELTRTDARLARFVATKLME